MRLPLVNVAPSVSPSIMSDGRNGESLQYMT